MTHQAPADWQPDPFGRHELRYWDGSKWTQHVASGGHQAIDPPVANPAQPATHTTTRRVGRGDRRVGRQVRKAGASGAKAGGGTLFTEPVLVVNQEATQHAEGAEYLVYDQQGHVLGAVREFDETIHGPAGEPQLVQRSGLRIVDANGWVVMTLVRQDWLFWSTVLVIGPAGDEIGRIVQKTLGWWAGVNFELESGGKTVGSILQERDWVYSIRDTAGAEIGRITSTWMGRTKQWWAKADQYVVQIRQPQEGALQSVVVAASLAIDTVLRRLNDMRVTRSKPS